MVSAKAFLKELVERVPYRIHTVLTDNGIQFADRPQNRNGPTALFRGHPFDRVCWQHGIEHQLTQINHPWTNRQAERMNRTLKETTVNRYHYESHASLQEHLDTFVTAYNFAKRLKVLRGLTPYESIVKSWQEHSELFHTELIYLTEVVYILKHILKHNIFKKLFNFYFHP
ncbi:Mobile element protein [Bilophila wadsworthia]